MELWQRAAELQAEIDSERLETDAWFMVDADLGDGVHASYPSVLNPEHGDIRYFATGTEKRVKPYVVTEVEWYHFDELPDDCRIPIGVARFVLYGTETTPAITGV